MTTRLVTIAALSTALLALSSCKERCCCGGRSQKTEKKASSQNQKNNTTEHKEKSAPIASPKEPKRKKHQEKAFLTTQPTPFAYRPNPDGSNAIAYEPRTKDPVLKEMTKRRKEEQTRAKERTAQIVAKQKALKKELKTQQQRLRSDLGSRSFPKDIKEFNTAPHLPPVPQFYTGTCWSFATASYFESEILRLKKRRIKLSEMWTVYHAYVEKARRYITTRGHSFVGEGDEPSTTLFLWKRYGVVPLSAYKGLPKNRTRHDHRALIKEIKAYLKFVATEELWDEVWNLKHVRLILDRHLGPPPKTVVFDGKTYTPLTFFKEVTGLNPDAYISVISTARHPWYTWQVLDAPDNWRRNGEYLNAPLKSWFAALQKGLQSGHTVVIGGDVSEPGKVPERDLFFVPTFDIPSSLINQHSRELRIANRSTTDDHGIHLLGAHRSKGAKWFVFKDSGRSSRYGKHKGYYFVSADYLKLKILTWYGHRSLAASLLQKATKKSTLSPKRSHSP